MEENKEALLLEEKKIRRLRVLTDLTCAVLWQGDLSLSEAQKLIAHTRERALELFPDKGEAFDLIYGSRFRRILNERYRLL